MSTQIRHANCSIPGLSLSDLVEYGLNPAQMGIVPLWEHPKTATIHREEDTCASKRPGSARTKRVLITELVGKKLCGKCNPDQERSDLGLIRKFLINIASLEALVARLGSYGYPIPPRCLRGSHESLPGLAEHVPSYEQLKLADLGTAGPDDPVRFSSSYSSVRTV